MKLRYFGIGLAAVGLAVECVFIPAEASALTAALTDPPVTSVPGPYYNQGDFIGICVGGPGSYIEVHTNFGTHASPNPNALGNCAPGRTQLVVAADPSLYPIPTPTPTSTG